MILQGLLSGLILFGSVAFRTPNNPDITKDDYEISLGFKNKSIYLKRDWERELGEKYIDDELWFVYEPKGFPLYFKPEYVNKTSRDLQYGKVDTRYKRDWCTRLVPQLKLNFHRRTSDYYKTTSYP